VIFDNTFRRLENTDMHASPEKMNSIKQRAQGRHRNQEKGRIMDPFVAADVAKLSGQEKNT